MKKFTFAALFSGALFGLGLAMSGMTDARRILGFLDLFGEFDPTLLFVLGGAVATTTLLFRFVLRRGSPVLASSFHLSKLKHIGGVNWLAMCLEGWRFLVAGFGPGPARAGLGIGSIEWLWFVTAMIAGMLLHRVVDGERSSDPKRT